MTEKRYSRMTNHYGTSRTYCTGVYDNQNNRELKNASQVITELNALHEENEQLKQDKTNLHRAMSRNRVRYLNENEKLKHRNELLEEELGQCRAVIDKQWSEYLKKKEGQKND